MEHSQLLERETRRNCSTWNTRVAISSIHFSPHVEVVLAAHEIAAISCFARLVIVQGQGSLSTDPQELVP